MISKICLQYLAQIWYKFLPLSYTGLREDWLGGQDMGAILLLSFEGSTTLQRVLLVRAVFLEAEEPRGGYIWACPVLMTDATWPRSASMS